MDADSSEINRLRGKKKKKLFLKIKTQMEFYFSDSNLAKDKFLRKLINENDDGYVNLEVFKTFNKIKSLSEDVEIIAAAVSKSDKLQLSDDRSKLRRTTPFGEPKDFDACTAYVEKLPSHADHKWIKDVFEHFGPVDYITIPRFKTSNKIKGFAFIEFNDPASVEKACEYYKNLMLKETSKAEESVENKSERSKKHRHRGSNKDTNELPDDKNRKRKASSDLETTPKKVCLDQSSKSDCRSDCEKSDCDSSEKQKQHHQKRKADIECCEQPPKRKKESSLSETEPQSLLSDHNEDSDAQVEQHPECPTKDLNTGETVEVSEEEEVNKNKRKKKHRKRHHSERPLLRVMSKYEWKSYRNQYLSLQRSTMSVLKKQILLETHEWREHELSVSTEEAPKKSFHVQTGVLLRVTLQDSISDPAVIKEKVKSSCVVAYVDAKLGHSEMFIRCHKPEDAQHIVKEEQLKHMGTVHLLAGEEEENYIKKIEEDRKARFSVPLVRKKRGRDKLIAKATRLMEQKNKHVYFDE